MDMRSLRMESVAGEAARPRYTNKYDQIVLRRTNLLEYAHNRYAHVLRRRTCRGGQGSNESVDWR